MATSPRRTWHSARRNGASVASKALLSASGGEIAEEGQAACLGSAARLSRNRRRKSAAEKRESTRTGRKKPGLQVIQREPSGDRPQPGTMTCTYGWWVRAEPQLWRTAVRPMRAPRCLGSAAIVISVLAAVRTTGRRRRSDHRQPGPPVRPSRVDLAPLAESNYQRTEWARALT